MKVRLTNAVITTMFVIGLNPTSQAGDLDSWQRDLALSPPGYILDIEDHKSRVWILKGLVDSDVEQAMDEQFNRIEHFMFIQTKHVEPDGEVWVQEEGCD